MPGKQKKNIPPKAPKPAQSKAVVKNELLINVPKWAIAAVLALTAIIYLRSLFNDFVVWDDDMYLKLNPFLKDFSLKGLHAIFSSFYFSNYHPLTTLTYWFENKFYGLNPLPFHLLNLLLHLVNTWLVYKLVEKLSSKSLTAIIVAVLFALHPMHVESVAWVAERKDVLYTLFYLASLLVYLRYFENGFKIKYYLFSLLLFIASLLSKSAAVTLPVLLIAIDIYKGRKINIKFILEKIPFLLLSLVFGIVTILAQKQLGAINEISLSFNFTDRIFLILGSFIVYIIKFVAPFALSAMHYYPVTHGGALPWHYYASLPFLIFLGWLIFRPSKFRKEIIFGTFFFLISISVMLQIIPVGNSQYSERYTYVPYLGLFFIAAELIQGISKTQMRKVAFIMLALYVVFFSFLTWQRIGVWKNGETLFTDVIRKYPDNSNGYMVRGNIKYAKSDTLSALQDYNTSLKFNPKNFLCLINRGEILKNKGDFNQAITDMNNAIRLDSTMEKAYDIRAYSLYKSGKMDSAVSDYNKVIQMNPATPEAYINRGNAFYKSGKNDKAITDFNKAIQLDSTNAMAYYDRGNALNKNNDVKSALNDFNKAIILNPKFTIAYNNRAMLKEQTGDTTGAVADIDKAISLAPANADYYGVKAYFRAFHKNYKAAVTDFNRAIELNPNDNLLYFNRAFSLYNLNDKTAACRDWTKAESLGNAQAKDALKMYCR